MKNRFKRLFQCILLSAVMISGGLCSIPASAEITTGTDVTVEFEAGVGPTFPVDPDNPGIPLDPQPPEGAEGPLALVYASDFAFGEVEIANTKASYDITTDRPNVQIVDLRGAGSGWNLRVKVAPFMDAGETPAQSLPGSYIVISKGRLSSLTEDAFKPTILPNRRIPTNGDEVKLMQAELGMGRGLWVERFYPEDKGEDTEDAYVQLEVAAGTATVGVHTTTITWILSDGP